MNGGFWKDIVQDLSIHIIHENIVIYLYITIHTYMVGVSLGVALSPGCREDQAGCSSHT